MGRTKFGERIVTSEYRIFPDGILRRHVGALTSAKVIESRHKTETIPHFTALRWMISDLREVTSVDIPPGVMEDLVASAIGASFSNDRIRIAIVATREEVIAVARQFIDAVPHYPMRIFSTLDEAREWVGVADKGIA